jgi:hypothetical protein
LLVRVWPRDFTVTVDRKVTENASLAVFGQGVSRNGGIVGIPYGLHFAYTTSVALILVAPIASLMRWKWYIYEQQASLKQPLKRRQLLLQSAEKPHF